MNKYLAGVLAVSVLAGCGGDVKQLQMKDVAGTSTVVEFPKGAIAGAASGDQAVALAQIFVDSHNMALGELSEIKANTHVIKQSVKQTTERVEAALKRLEDSNRKILESSKSNLETAEKALRLIEELSKRQGTGEITIFYPVGSGEIKKDGLEYERLVRFADFLSREGRGRKLLLISIGSASAIGDNKSNQKLAMKRSEAPVDILDKYLVNIPHEFYKVYGTGDLYSPKNVSMKEHQRYQHARIIVVFETAQLPSLP